MSEVSKTKPYSSHKPPHSNASILVQFIALILANGTLLSVLLIIITPVLFFPFKSACLYVYLPYITYMFLFPIHKKDGLFNLTFTKYWPLFFINKHLHNITVSCAPEFAKAEKEKDAQFIIGLFPHGADSGYRVLLQGMLPEFMPNTCTKVRTLAASVLFVIPIIREMSLWSGCIDASRKTAEYALKTGKSIFVIPGGEAEQLLTERGVEKLYLKERLGFVKLALRFNTKLVPAYVFGANDVFYTSMNYYDQRHWLMKNYGVCIPLASGLLRTQCPLPVKLSVVFGAPLSFKCKVDGSPTSEEVVAAHKAFMVAIEKLFNEKKGEYGFGDRELIIA